MKKLICYSIIIFLTGCSAEKLLKKTENKDPNLVMNRGETLSEENKKQNWPSGDTTPDGKPKYADGTLGKAMQFKFKEHCDFCGFNITNPNKRDYIPSDISKFIGSKTLDDKVELADYQMGGVLFYIFKGEELNVEFDKISFSDNFILDRNYPNQFDIKASEFSDYFLMIKSCGGYINAKLDAKIKPPYSSFQAAVQNDLEQSSTIIAIRGKFYSPLKELMDGGNYPSIHSYMKLWKLYLTNSSYKNNAFYLREFEGVMIKRIASSKSLTSLSGSVGLNFNGPMDISIAASVAAGLKTESAFSGRDWQTIILSKFNSLYPRISYFDSLPTVDQILSKLKSINPIYRPGDIEYFTAGDEHKHYIRIFGIPKEMCEGFWMIEMPNNNVYQNNPVLTPRYYTEADGRFGCEFEIKGTPQNEIVSGNSIVLNYKIKSISAIDGKSIEFNIEQNIGTSKIPYLKIAGPPFKIKHENLISIGSNRYQIRWSVIIDVNDDNRNLVDYARSFVTQKVTANYNGKDFGLTPNIIESDRIKKQITIILTSADQFDLDQIDESSEATTTVNMEISIPKRQGSVIRPVFCELSIPIKVQLN